VIGVVATAAVVYYATGGPEAVSEGLEQTGEVVTDASENAWDTIQTVFSRPRNNQSQNDQFRGAVSEIEHRLGRTLTDDEIQELHHTIQELEDPGY
jgi:hypothetical protein